MTVPTYAQNVATDAAQLASDADDLANALAGGAAGQTVSMRAALAQQRGALWGCWMCAALSVLVQRHHCRHTLAGDPVPWTVCVRAAACFAVVLLGVPAVIWWVG